MRSHAGPYLRTAAAVTMAAMAAMDSRGRGTVGTVTAEGGSVGGRALHGRAGRGGVSVMTDGEWWRKSGPWSERAGASGSPGESASSSASSASSAEASAAGPAGPAEDSVYGPPAASGATDGIPNVSLDLPGVAGPGGGSEAIPPPTVQSSSPWTMTMLDFSDAPQPAPRPIPDQRAAEEAAQQQAAAPAGAQPSSPKRQRKAKAKAKARAGAKAAPAAGAGSAKGARKPSPLILLSCGLLVGGAVSGFFPAMLAGWGLGYLTRQLSDLMRKFVILGIPLITMSATTLFAMNHAKQAGGAGGGAVQPGSPLGQFSWSMAPGVLRTAAVATAVVLLLLGLRRRPPQQG
ncbi:hypothetical protein [Kitasatospora aureofaciens]|uniref:hypothetical protein n=1 Tax=Kitasatospora aureofaciens TaxID=1894 RepID=UPI0036F45D32